METRRSSAAGLSASSGGRDSPARTEGLTWVDAVAGDIGSFQPLGEFVCEEHVTQFTAAVGLEELPAVLSSAEVFVHGQSLETHKAPHEHLRGGARTGDIIPL